MIEVVKGKIIAEKITQSPFDAGTESVQLRQETVTQYVSQKADKSGGLFTGVMPQTVNAEYKGSRVAFIAIPKGAMTLEEIQAKIDASPDAAINRILSNKMEDVLTEGQKQWKESNPDFTIEQVPDADGNPLGFFRRLEFSLDGKWRSGPAVGKFGDVDLRTTTTTTEAAEVAQVGEEVQKLTM